MPFSDTLTTTMPASRLALKTMRLVSSGSAPVSRMSKSGDP
jgi:hypothetical protein